MSDREVRRENIAAVLRAVVATTPGERLVRDEVARRSGVSRGTVTRALDVLRDAEDARRKRIEDAGLVGDYQPLLLFPPVRPRRGQADYVWLNARGGYLAALEVSHRRLTACVTDLFGKILSPNDWRTLRRVNIDTEPDRTMDAGANLLRDVVGERRGRQLIAVGLSVAAPVDPVTKRVRALKSRIQAPTRRTWVGKAPIEMLNARLGDWGCEVGLSNDANAAAWAQFLASRGSEWLGYGGSIDDGRRELQDLLHLKWSSGLGCGVVAGGRLHTSTSGLAGELGHVPVPDLPDDLRPDPDDYCGRCGRLTCLENIAGYNRIKRRLGLDPTIPRIHLEQDPRFADLIEELAFYVGATIAGAATVIAPQLIVISGPPPNLEDGIRSRFKKGFTSTALPTLADSVTIMVAQPLDVDDDERRLTVVTGALALARDKELLPHLLRQLVPEEAEADDETSRADEASGGDEALRPTGT